MSIAQRFQALLENPHLKANQGDYKFALSLQQAYEKQGRLTPGRRPWLDKLESKYSEVEVAKRLENQDNSLIARLERLLARTEDNSWAMDFTNSVLGQVRSGRTLSTAQLSTIARLEKENSDEALAERNTFAVRYNDVTTGLREKATIAAKYYSKGPYFNSISERVLGNENFVPTFSQYNKLVENKYAQKVLEGYYAEPKFQLGSLVQLRQTAPKFCGKKAVVIGVNVKVPHSACAGNKVYHLLPLGETNPVEVEERHIMNWKAANKK